MAKTLEERFWTKVSKKSNDECWEWQAGKCKGYGLFWIKSKKSRARANRVVWELSFGSIPENMQVLHKCDNPACCNPSHLFLGTHQDNMRDMIQKGRNKICNPNPFSTENEDQIKSLYFDQHYSFRKIDRMFFVDHSKIRRFIYREIQKASF